jgi:hypothetical protein
MKYILYIGIAIILIIAGMFLYKKGMERGFDKGMASIKGDTVYVDKFYPVVSYYKEKQSPQIIYRYLPQPYEVIKDSIIKVVMTDTVEVRDSYIGQYPLNDKLIQLLLKSEKLSLITLDQFGSTLCREYDLDVSKFEYNWRDGELSRKNVSFWRRFHGYTSADIGAHGLVGLRASLLYETLFGISIGFGGNIVYVNRETYLYPSINITYKLF